MLTQTQRTIRKWRILALRSSHIFSRHDLDFVSLLTSELMLNFINHLMIYAGLVYCQNIVPGMFSSSINCLRRFENPDIAPVIAIVP